MLCSDAIAAEALCETDPALLPETQTVIARYATRTFATRASDSPANTTIKGLINSGLRLSRKLNAGPEGQFGSLIGAALSEIELNNESGVLDPIPKEFFADGRPVVLKIGAVEILQRRIMPQYIAQGTGASSGDSSVPYPLDFPAGVGVDDLLIAQITINDRISVVAGQILQFGGQTVDYGGQSVEF